MRCCGVRLGCGVRCFGVRFDGAASVPRFGDRLTASCRAPWANTDGIHAVLKVFERGFGGKIFSKIFQPNGTHSNGASRTADCAQLIAAQSLKQL